MASGGAPPQQWALAPPQWQGMVQAWPMNVEAQRARRSTRRQSTPGHGGVLGTVILLRRHPPRQQLRRPTSRPLLRLQQHGPEQPWRWQYRLVPRHWSHSAHGIQSWYSYIDPSLYCSSSHCCRQWAVPPSTLYRQHLNSHPFFSFTASQYSYCSSNYQKPNFHACANS
jgi:hypothetical protein